MRKQRRRSVPLFSLHNAFVFATISPLVKFEISVCVRPGRKPQRPVFLCHGSFCIHVRKLRLFQTVLWYTSILIVLERYYPNAAISTCILIGLNMLFLAFKGSKLKIKISQCLISLLLFDMSLSRLFQLI